MLFGILSMIFGLLFLHSMMFHMFFITSYETSLQTKRFQTTLIDARFYAPYCDIDQWEVKRQLVLILAVLKFLLSTINKGKQVFPIKFMTILKFQYKAIHKCYLNNIEFRGMAMGNCKIISMQCNKNKDNQLYHHHHKFSHKIS